MKKVLYFTMKSCGPCKIIGPQVKDLCRKYDVPLEEVWLDSPESRGAGTAFGVFMTPEVVVLDGLTSLTAPLDTQQGIKMVNIPAAELPAGLEKYLKPVGHPLPEDPIDPHAKPKKEKNALITGGKIILALYCIKKIFF